MNIKFLGTGAADWQQNLPHIKTYRRFSSIMINDDLLIDPGPQIYSFAKDFNFPTLYNNITNILLTHSHDDHLSLETLLKLSEMETKNLWCSNSIDIPMQTIPNILINKLSCFSTTTINGYTITAVPANHITENINEQALHYIIQKDNRTIFYGCDGAWLREETWYYMQKYKFDLLILDGTLLNGEGDYRIFEHNSLSMVKSMVKSIKKCNLLNPNGKIYISHLSLDSHGDLEITKSQLLNDDINIAYDGLTVCL